MPYRRWGDVWDLCCVGKMQLVHLRLVHLAAWVIRVQLVGLIAAAEVHE